MSSTQKGCQSRCETSCALGGHSLVLSPKAWFWHPSGMRKVVACVSGGRSPFALNDDRLPSSNPAGLDWLSNRGFENRTLARAGMDRGELDAALSLPLSSKGGEGIGAAASEHRDACKG